MVFFPRRRRLRQDNPLSPLLFISVMEALSRLIIEANGVGFLEGIHINSSRLEDVLITHLLFVDDTLIFGKPEEGHQGNLRCMLVLFEVILGFKINLSKSLFIPIVRCQSLIN